MIAAVGSGLERIGRFAASRSARVSDFPASPGAYQRSSAGSQPLDDFLNETGGATDTGEMLQRIGLLGSLIGITIAGGLVVFLAAVHRGTRREVASLLRVVAAAGALALIGAAVEIAGVGSVGDLGWSDAFTDESGSAPMIRLLAGFSILLGLFEHTVPVATDQRDVNGGHDGEVDNGGEVGGVGEVRDEVVRWVPASASAFGYVGIVIGIISFWFDGHTVSEGPRVVHAIVDFVHVAAGSVWFGGVVGLAVIAWTRRGSGSIAAAVVRFSAIASLALVVVALAGALMTLMIIDGFGDLTSTDWGRILIVKVAAVAVTAGIGGYNHFVVVPALDRTSTSVDGEAIARSTVTVEAVILLFVVTVTVFLTSASVN